MEMGYGRKRTSGISDGDRDSVKYSEENATGKDKKVAQA